MHIRLYFLQRLTAMLMLPLIVGHLLVVFYATRKGIAAAEILGRTRGSLGWGLYYGAFVVLASVHGAIGLRAVLREWGPRGLARNSRGLDLAMFACGGVLLALGLRAVAAVVLS